MWKYLMIFASRQTYDLILVKCYTELIKQLTLLPISEMGIIDA